jgi:hypothetical protein
MQQPPHLAHAVNTVVGRMQPLQNRHQLPIRQRPRRWFSAFRRPVSSRNVSRISFRKTSTSIGV